MDGHLEYRCAPRGCAIRGPPVTQSSPVVTQWEQFLCSCRVVNMSVSPCSLHTIFTCQPSFCRFARQLFLLRMQLSAHMVLLEKLLPAASEWQPKPVSLTFLQVRQGDGFFLQTGKPWQLTEGDLLILPPRGTGTFRASQLGQLRLEYFYVVLELLSGILTHAEHQHLARMLQEDGWLPQFHEASSTLAGQFSCLSSAHRRGQHLLARCQMLQLAMSVLMPQLPAHVPVEHDSQLTAMARFEELIRKLPEAELRYLSAAELAKLCGCGERHFRRLFKDHFGHALALKKTELRLVKARELLAETNSKIIDVAFESGFQHVGRFTLLFKKRYGLPPSEWRTRHRPAKSASKR